MDVEALVKAIAAEVLKQVDGMEERSSVLIIGDKGCTKCQATENKLGQGVRFLYPDEHPGTDVAIRRIVPYLSIRHMADLATGKAEGPLMEMVLAALLAGQPVEVMEFEYKRYRDTAAEGLIRLFEGQQVALASYGLTAMDLTKRDTVRVRKSLVAEADVTEAAQRGAIELLIPVDALITPLAIEGAKELGMIISRG